MWKRCSFVETALFCGNCTLLWERHSCRDWFNLKNRGRSAAPTGQFNRAAPTLQQTSAGFALAPERCSVTPRLFQLADRKSTRLNSSHVRISYAVFCLKKKRETRVT